MQEKSTAPAPTFNPVFYRTYSRRDSGTRETWSDAVKRSVGGLFELGQYTEEEKELILNSAQDMIAMPSGRWLWVGGTDWVKQQKNFYGSYNCLQGSTPVLTKEFGIIPVRDLVDREVHVLTKDSEWSRVTFRSYGEDELVNVTLIPKTKSRTVASMATTVQATPGHRWILLDGTEKTTADLQDGDFIPFVTANRPEMNDAYFAGIQHGIVYGDGTEVSERFTYGSHKVRLCGKKAELLRFFPGNHTLFPPSYNGDPLVYVDGADFFTEYGETNLKALPSTSDPSYLLGFIRGLIATDGSCSATENNPTPAPLVSGTEETIEWVCKIAPIVGIECGKTALLKRSGTKSNYGYRKVSTWNVCFVVSTMVPDDFLRTFHRESFGSYATTRCWKVGDVSSAGVTEEVYCCEEPTTHTFVLGGGILTGNCSSTNIDDHRMFGTMMNLAMQGCGTGAVLEKHVIENLPPVLNHVNVKVIGEFGFGLEHQEDTVLNFNMEKNPSQFEITVGDSREGWCLSVQMLIDIALFGFGPELNVVVDVSHVRPKGRKLKGFGGVANPSKLKDLYPALAAILNGAHAREGQKLNSVESCLLIDECAKVIVAGNIRRSAGMRQGSSDDELFAVAKDNLWQQGEDGQWRIDPARDALRMANHTRVFHQKPTLEEVVASVTKQFHSGEGAIQYAPEAIARSNTDLLTTPELKAKFIAAYEVDPLEGAKFLFDLLLVQKGIDTRPDDSELQNVADELTKEIMHRLSRYGLNPCLTGNMRLLTIDGLKRFDELAGTEPMIINAQGDVSKSKVWCSGEKETVRISTTARDLQITCTPDHRWMTIDGREVEAKDLKGEQLKPFLLLKDHDPFYVLLGLLQGDGEFRKDHSVVGYTILNVGQNDLDMLDVVESCGYAWEWDTPSTDGMERRIRIFGINDDLQDFGFYHCPLPERALPKAFNDFTLSQKAAFLCGLFGANGSVIGKIGRVALKSTCFEMIEQVKDVFENDFGFTCYVTTNRERSVEFSNGTYTCRESYDLNIQKYVSRLSFYNEIGFALRYRNVKLHDALTASAPTVRAVLPNGVEKVYDFTEPLTHWGVVEMVVSHNCGEILLRDNFCNLGEVHLNRIDPFDFEAQEKAFKAGALATVALLHHEFNIERYVYSREIDPIVGVSFTGLFDFFVNAFGVEWLRWWEAGRPDTIEGLRFKEQEAEYLSRWKRIVDAQVKEYCDRVGIRTPNRCTTVQPAGSKSLLTGASPGWHPPKAQRFIRRITFDKGNPVALAMIDLGYAVTPSQSDTDENGNLLNDPFDPRCTEWLVEMPMSVSWADLPGADEIRIENFSAVAQFDFYSQVQKHYTAHNTSATIELREDEIEDLARAIHRNIENGGGYISAALLARFDANFPRLPFEKIDRETYERLRTEVMQRRKTDDFYAALLQHDQDAVDDAASQGPAQCDSDKCLMPEKK